MCEPSGPDGLRSQGQDAKMREHMVGLGIGVGRGWSSVVQGGSGQRLCSLRSNAANRGGSAIQSRRPGEHNEVQRENGGGLADEKKVCGPLFSLLNNDRIFLNRVE